MYDKEQFDRLHIILRKGQKERLRKYAVRKGQKMVDVIRLALDAFMAGKKEGKKS